MSFQVLNTMSALKKSNISVGGGVKSTTFVRVKQETGVTEGKSDSVKTVLVLNYLCMSIILLIIFTEEYLRYAHGLISEYISEELSKDLHKHLQYVYTNTASLPQ